jgi:hypothetical protein
VEKKHWRQECFSLFSLFDDILALYFLKKIALQNCVLICPAYLYDSPRCLAMKCALMTLPLESVQ